MAGGSGGALVGGLMGAAAGHASTTPVYLAPVSYPPAQAPSRMALDWNGFMQPSGR